MKAVCDRCGQEFASAQGVKVHKWRNPACKPMMAATLVMDAVDTIRRVKAVAAEIGGLGQLREMCEALEA